MTEDYIGLANPYTGQKIRTPEDYDEYLRQYALSLVYQNAYDSALKKFNTDLENTRRQAEQSKKEAVERVRKEEQKASQRSRRRGFLALILSVLLCLTLLFYLPSAKRTAYDEGLSAGESLSSISYDNGYRDGSSDAQKSEESRTVIEVKPVPYSPSNYSNSTSGGSSGSNFGTADTSSPYIGNSSTHKFHESTCSYLPSKANQVYFDTRDEAVEAGYVPCGHCNP